MAAFKTYIFPWQLFPSGHHELRINVGLLGADYCDANPSTTIRLSSTRWLLPYGDYSEEMSDDEGGVAGSAVDIMAQDEFHVEGLVPNVGGSAYSHDFQADLTSFLEDLFVDRSVLYEFYIMKYQRSGSAQSIVSSTNASPVVVTVTGHGYSNGDTVIITGHDQVNANGTWRIAGVTANTFNLVGSTGSGVGTGVGQVQKYTREVWFSGDLDPNVLTADHTLIHNPQTATEQRRGQVKIQVNSGTTRSSEKTVADLMEDIVRHPLTITEVTTNTGFYAGHIPNGDTYNNNVSTNPFNGPQFDVAHIQTIAPESESGPPANTAIKVNALLGRIAKVLGYVDGSGNGNSVISSAFDYFIKQFVSAETAGSITALDIAVTSWGNLWRVTKANHGYAVQDIVQITLAAGAAASWLNGLWRICLVGTNHFLLEQSTPGALSMNNDFTSGTCQKFIYDFVNDGTNCIPYDVNQLEVSFEHLFGIDLFHQRAVAIVSSTNTSPIVITATAHGFATGDTVVITNHDQLTANGQWSVTVLSGSTFSLDTSVGSGVGTGKGIAEYPHVEYPITFKYDRTLKDLVKALCFQYGCAVSVIPDINGRLTYSLLDRRTEKSLYYYDAFGVLQFGSGHLPTSLKLTESSVEEAVEISKKGVAVNNTGDSEIVYSPKNDSDLAKIEILWRAHDWGMRDDQMVFDSSFVYGNQWRRFKNNIAGIDGNTDVAPNFHTSPDGWLGGSLLYMYVGTGSSRPTLYPSDYETKFNIGAGYLASVAFVTMHGQSMPWPVPPTIVALKQYNTTVAAAQFWEEELVGDKIVITRTYSGVTDDSGSMLNIRPGITAQWYFRQALRTFRARSVKRNIVNNSTTIKWVEVVDPATRVPPTVIVSGNAAQTTSGGSSSSSSSSSNTNVPGAAGNPLLPFVPVSRTIILYSGGVAVSWLLATTFEYSGDNGVTNLAEFAFVAMTRSAPAPMQALLRKATNKWGTGTVEKGNCEIVGVSATGVPDYVLDFHAAIPAYNSYSGGKANAVNPLLSSMWNDKFNVFDVVRPYGKVSVGSRVKLQGRFILKRDNTGSPPTGGVLSAQWIDNNTGSTITDTVTPTSGSEIMNSAPMLGVWQLAAYNGGFNYLQNDLVPYNGVTYQRNGTTLGTSGHLPTNATYWSVFPTPNIPECPPPNWNQKLSANFLFPIITPADIAGTHTAVDILFTPRMKVVKASVQLNHYSWRGTHPGYRLYITMGTADQKDNAGGSNVNKFSFQLGCADFQAQTAIVNLPNTMPGGGGSTNYTVDFTGNLPVDRETLLQNLDELRVEVEVTVEITGDDLSVF